MRNNDLFLAFNIIQYMYEPMVIGQSVKSFGIRAISLLSFAVHFSISLLSSGSMENLSEHLLYSESLSIVWGLTGAHKKIDWCVVLVVCSSFIPTNIVLDICSSIAIANPIGYFPVRWKSDILSVACNGGVRIPLRFATSKWNLEARALRWSKYQRILGMYTYTQYTC